MTDTMTTPLLWCRDSVSCVQSTIAAVAHRAGLDPLEPLGAGWQFTYLPGDVTNEEFYVPTPDGDLARTVCPHHPIRSAWRVPGEGADPLHALAGWLDAGVWPVAAVDNYHLPFRPAYHDVHAAHLLIVYGIDRSGERVWVSDAMPPAYQGPIAAADFLAAWSSGNPADPQDDFFSSRRIERRWLELTVTEPASALDEETLLAAIRADTAAYDEGGLDPVRRGRDGLARWSAEVTERAAAGDGAALTETYVLGWSQQAQADLHAELLLDRGRRWRRPDLAEAGRLVQRAAHAWTGVRITAAHNRLDPRRALPDLRRHLTRLRGRFEEAHDRLSALSDR
jgi:butirosin biosynthesis protein H-like